MLTPSHISAPSFPRPRCCSACTTSKPPFGRIRTVRNAARAIDLDLLAYDDRVLDRPELTLPHPRIASRAFVLLPLADIAPRWRDPVSGSDVATWIANLPPGQDVRRLKDEA